MALGKTIAFLGAGNMAEALVKGLLRAKVAEAREIICSDRNPARAELTQRYGVRFTSSNREAAEVADLVVLSVKPQIMNKLLDEVAPVLDQKKLVISIAAGVPIAAIERKVGHGVRIVRTMPNTPALVGAGATALTAGEHATGGGALIAWQPPPATEERSSRTRRSERIRRLAGQVQPHSTSLAAARRTFRGPTHRNLTFCTQGAVRPEHVF